MESETGRVIELSQALERIAELEERLKCPNCDGKGNPDCYCDGDGSVDEAYELVVVLYLKEKKRVKAAETQLGAVVEAVTKAREYMQICVDGLISFEELYDAIKPLIGFTHDEHMPCSFTNLPAAGKEAAEKLRLHDDIVLALANTCKERDRLREAAIALFKIDEETPLAQLEVYKSEIDVQAALDQLKAALADQEPRPSEPCAKCNGAGEVQSGIHQGYDVLMVVCDACEPEASGEGEK